MRILIADDSASTRIVLRKVLREWGHEAVQAADGKEAWDILAADDPPRIAVLDWNMPEVDGVYVCKRLAERETGPFIYRILLTSMNEKEDLVFALENGAHSFLGKPVEPAILRSHIDVGARLIASEDRLTDYAAQMERLAGERAQQLIHAERLASVGALAAGLFHELNSPVTFVDGHLQTLKKVWEAVEPHMPRLVEENPEDERLALAARSVPEVLHDALEGMRRIRETIHNMKGYAGRGQSEPLPFHVNEAIRAALRLCQSVLRHHAEVVEDLAPDLPPVVGHAAKLEQVFVNLFHNAADALDGRGDGRLRVASRLTEDGIEVIVEDDGPGLPADRIDRIWEPFYTEKSRGEGLGIGLAISHAIIEEMEGRILAENRPEGGARFTLTLPAGAKA